MDLYNPSLGRLPVLDGSNYKYWKIQMRRHIKNIDMNAWRAVINGYFPPQRAKDKHGDVVLKPKSEWTIEETNLARYNEKAMNAIFGTMSIHVFKLIQNCTTAKDAWDILQRHFEGDASVGETPVGTVADVVREQVRGLSAHIDGLVKIRDALLASLPTQNGGEEVGTSNI